MTATYTHDGFTFLTRDPEDHSHTAPIEHPVWVNLRDRIGDFVVPPVKWLWRMVLRFSDWVDRWAEVIVGVIVAVVLILGVVLVLAFYDFRFLAIMVSLFGLVGVTAVVAYKAGASRG